MKKYLIINLCFLFFPINSIATTLFSDNFDDANADGWTFYGSNSGDWSATSGALNHNTPSGYDGTIEFALIDGITTPDQFTLEADISIISSNKGSDWGHVGFVWGVNDIVAPFDSFNTSYLRTHQDHVTNWSKLNGGGLFQQFLNTPGTTNGVSYHLSIEVDYLARTMITSLGGSTTTFSGSNFDKINQNSGGGIGLMSANDNIIFDNVVLSTPSSVPEPTSLALLGLGLAGFGFLRKKKST